MDQRHLGSLPQATHSLQALHYRHLSEENVAIHKNLKSSYQKLIRKTKTEHWKAFCSENLNSDLFNVLKTLATSSAKNTDCFPSSLTVGNSIHSDPESILRAFSRHFCLKNPVDLPLHDSLMSAVNLQLNNNNSCCTDDIKSSELDTAVQNLKRTRTPGTDGLSTSWLQLLYVSTHQ